MASVVDRLAQRGIAVVISAGNQGYAGAYFWNSFSVGEHSISVGSIDNSEKSTVAFQAKLKIDNQDAANFSYQTVSPSKWDGQPRELWSPSNDPNASRDACDPFPADTPSLADKVVFMRLGGCATEDKTANAAAKGAAYILFYGDTKDYYTGYYSHSGLKAADFVLQETGQAWARLLKDGKSLTATISNLESSELDLTTVQNTKTGGAMSVPSGWGPTPRMGSTTLAAAAGGQILSAWPRSLGSWAVQQGTSMAAPAMAGIIALVMEARKDQNITVDMMRNLISSTSKARLFNDGNANLKGLAPVAQQGPGAVQAWDVAFSQSVLSPTLLSFNDTATIPKNLTFSIHNLGSAKTEFTIGQVQASGYILLTKDAKQVARFPGELFESSIELGFSDSKVVVEAGKSKMIAVTLTNHGNEDPSRVPYHSGWVVVNGTDGSALELPYHHAGIDFTSMRQMIAGATIIHNSTTDTPVDGHPSFVLPKRGSWTPQDTAPIPVVLFSLILASPYVDLQVLSLSANKTVGSLPDSPMREVRKNPIRKPWDGRLDDGSYAPAGDYKIVARVLRLYGDADNAKHWDTEDSIPINISYQE